MTKDEKLHYVTIPEKCLLEQQSFSSSWSRCPAHQAHSSQHCLPGGCSLTLPFGQPSALLLPTMTPFCVTGRPLIHQNGNCLYSILCGNYMNISLVLCSGFHVISAFIVTLAIHMTSKCSIFSAPSFMAWCSADLHLKALRRDEQLMTHINLSISHICLATGFPRHGGVQRAEEKLVYGENVNLPVIPAFCVHPLLSSLQ